MRARGAVRDEPQDLRAERGQDPALGRDLEVIELVQVADELGVRLLVLLGGFGMPDAETEQGSGLGAWR